MSPRVALDRVARTCVARARALVDGRALGGAGRGDVESRARSSPHPWARTFCADGDAASAREGATATATASDGPTSRTGRERRARASPMKEANVYVKNMAPGVTERALRETFRRFGPIASARALNPDGPWPGGLVRFVRAEDARKAIEAAADGGLGTLEGAPGALLVRLAEKKRDGANVGGDEGMEGVDPIETSAALERRKAELADRRQFRAERLASERVKAQEMSEARRAERVAAAKENIKTFVPRYKRVQGAGTGAELTLDPSLRASASSRRMKDGQFTAGIQQRKRGQGRATNRSQRRGDGVDAHIQQALNERIRQARQLQAANETYDYDRHEFVRASFLLTNEKLDVNHIVEKPRLVSEAVEINDEEVIEKHKPWLMEAAGISSEEEYQLLKNEAIEARTQERVYERLMRKRAGLSPFTDNFLAERASLASIFAGVSDDNVLSEFSKMAVNTLDSNPFWKYSDKVRLLERLEREAGNVSGMTAEAD